MMVVILESVFHHRFRDCDDRLLRFYNFTATKAMDIRRRPKKIVDRYTAPQKIGRHMSFALVILTVGYRKLYASRQAIELQRGCKGFQPVYHPAGKQLKL